MSPFFLIALVLLFTPKYMELFGPQNPNPTSSYSNEDQHNKNDSLLFLKDSIPKLTRPEPERLPDRLHDNTVTNIETELYVAKVSSFNGGSIKDFFLKGFLSPDSQEVNTIARNKKNNLEIEIQDLNGDLIPLNVDWALTTQPNRLTKNSEQTLEYSLELFPGKKIKKHFCFLPTTTPWKSNLTSNKSKILYIETFAFHGTEGWQLRKKTP